MATEARAERGWAWPALALGAGAVLFVTVPALDRAALDAQSLAASAARSALGLLLLGVGASALARRPLVDALGLVASRPPLRAGEALLFCLGLVALSVALDRAVDALGLRDESRLAWLERFFAQLAGADLVLVIAGVALAPAVAEEIVFRGVLLGALRRRGSAAVAVLASALVFGAVHFDLAQGLAAACLGLYLGVLAIATGSVRACILAHALNNALAVVAPSLSDLLLRRPPAAFAAGLGLAIALVAALGLIARRLRAAPPSGPP